MALDTLFLLEDTADDQTQREEQDCCHQGQRGVVVLYLGATVGAAHPAVGLNSLFSEGNKEQQYIKTEMFPKDHNFLAEPVYVTSSLYIVL